MSALPTLSRDLTGKLETAALSLQDEQANYAGAVVEVAEAKRALEIARARRLTAGIDGRNEAQRDAMLRVELHGLYDEVHEAEQTLTEARCALERARLEWDLARYTVRAWEVSR